MDWDAEDLRASLTKRQNGMNMAKEDELLDIFPPYAPPEEIKGNRMSLLRGPAVAVDSWGRLLYWHLPGIFLPRRQVSTSLARSSMPESMCHSSGPFWMPRAASKHSSTRVLIRMSGGDNLLVSSGQGLTGRPASGTALQQGIRLDTRSAF